MKQIIVMLSFMVIGTCSVFGQNFEVRLVSCIGVSPASLDSKINRFERAEKGERHLNLTQWGLDANYFFRPDKKLSFFLGSGLKYSNNKSYPFPEIFAAASWFTTSSRF